MADQNQRRHPRIRTRIQARLGFSQFSIEGTIENIGQGGAFFATDTLEGSIHGGESVEVSFVEAETGDDVKLRGTVLRVERYFHEGGLYRAFAVKFDELYTPPATA